jgi:hypothetical protein
MDTPIGRIVTADEVCDAVSSTLQAWLPVVLPLLDDELEQPNDYQQVPDQEAIETAALPTVGIFTPGLSEEPVRDSDGDLDLTWRVTVVAFVRGDDYSQTQHRTRLFAAAISTVLIQQKTLLGFADSTRLVSEEYEPVTTGARTIGGAIVEVDVKVCGARNDLGAPDQVPPDDLSTHVVTDVGVDVTTEA